MPIRPENMSSYPGGSTSSPEWQAIRAFMRARAGDRCEGCGLRHLTYGVRLDDDFTDLGLDRDEAVCERELAILMVGHRDQMPPLIRIVCTVAHFDHGVDNHHTSNLRFWCQQCHNRHDARDRAAGIKRRRQESQATLQF